jgi:Fe-Mn family superoxide dismutase
MKQILKKLERTIKKYDNLIKKNIENTGLEIYQKTIGSFLDQEPVLPYTESTLSPFLSQKAVHLHYHKDHLRHFYLLRKHKQRHPCISDLKVKKALSSFIGPIQNTLSQCVYHHLFWRSMNAFKVSIPDSLSQAICATYTSLWNFKESLRITSENHFGSGYLIVGVLKKPDSITPVITHKVVSNSTPCTNYHLYPILVIDLWQHAWYLDYAQNKPQYFENLWSYIDWSCVEKRRKVIVLEQFKKAQLQSQIKIIESKLNRY